MRLYLLTVEGAEQFGTQWTIAPTVRLQTLIEQGPSILMPMAGDEVELHLPDGQVVGATIVSFGVSLWKGSDGSFYTDSDPADPVLTLTITCESDLKGIPSGTEIWLSNARSPSSSDSSSETS